MNADRRRWWALAALALAMLTIGLDGTVLNVAVPTMATALHASTDQLQWFSTAYTLVLAAALLPAGMLGDRFGRKKFLLSALVVFGAASAWCAASTSPEMLIAARSLLGLAAAVMMPMSMAVLPVLFPNPKERSRAITVWVTSTAIGLPLGPIVGGYLLNHFWWGSVFLINVPLVLVGVVAVAALVPESRSSSARRLDLVGVLLSSTGLLGLTYGVIAAGRDGWGAAAALLPLGLGVVFLAGLVVWERGRRDALIDVRLLQDRDFRTGMVLSVLVSFALMGLLFAMPLFFQEVGGSDALTTGLKLLPLIGGLLIGTRLAAKLEPATGVKAVLAGGLAVLALSLGLGALTDVSTGYGMSAIWISTLGVGLGLAMPTAMALATNTLTADRAGAGSALLQAVRQMGGTIGVALLGSVLSSSYRTNLGDSLPAAIRSAANSSVSAGVAVASRAQDALALHTVRAAFVSGIDLMLLVSAGVAVVGIVIALLHRPTVPTVPVTPFDGAAAPQDGAVLTHAEPAPPVDAADPRREQAESAV